MTQIRILNVTSVLFKQKLASRYIIISVATLKTVYLGNTLLQTFLIDWKTDWCFSIRTVKCFECSSNCDLQKTCLKYIVGLAWQNASLPIDSQIVLSIWCITWRIRKRICGQAITWVCDNCIWLQKNLASIGYIEYVIFLYDLL